MTTFQEILNYCNSPYPEITVGKYPKINYV